MNTKLKIFIIAGEVSGDILGAKIMKELPNVEFVGVGGENMIKQGLKSIFPISDIAVMGIVEVLSHVKTLQNRINQTIQSILLEKPDIVLTIDSPGFARPVIKAIKKQHLLPLPKFYHVVAPQVWAWGAKRAKKFANTFDKLYCFFDFEVPFFTKYGLKTIAVGHPIAEGLNKYKTNTKQTNVITLIPGSRLSEVKKTLPILRKVVREISAENPTKYHYVIPTVETTDSYIKQATYNWVIQPTIIPSKDR
ncbi:MAG: lipid-A-disaccharide synthase, partial [Alphaproteobacteria bacterium]|nr:lipid-A-disaccharide synthase [Alphaproteobacteria bacterium]